MTFFSVNIEVSDVSTVRLVLQILWKKPYLV